MTLRPFAYRSRMAVPPWVNSDSRECRYRWSSLGRETLPVGQQATASGSEIKMVHFSCSHVPEDYIIIILTITTNTCVKLLYNSLKNLKNLNNWVRSRKPVLLAMKCSTRLRRKGVHPIKGNPFQLHLIGKSGARRHYLLGKIVV